MASRAMPEPEAQKEIEVLSCASQDPVLSDDQIALAVRKSKRADSEGRGPAEEGWIPTFDTNYGAAQAWEMKASNAARRFNVQDAGQRFERVQVMNNCKAQAKYYRGLLSGTVTVPGPEAV